MNNKRQIWKAVFLPVLVLIWLCSISAMASDGSDDNSLYSLGITTEGAEVSPEFVYSTIEYNVTVPAGTEKLELDPIPSNENARIVDITGTELVDGKTTVEIVVEAQNGSQYSYFLYVAADGESAAAQAAPETEPETEPQTETEPETEDPRYVKVDRGLMEEAENTISTLKTESSNYRDRVDLLTKILYGMIAFCVVLLFIVINLLLKKKDMKDELQEYRGYGLDLDKAGAEHGRQPRMKPQTQVQMQPRPEVQQSSMGQVQQPSIEQEQQSSMGQEQQPPRTQVQPPKKNKKMKDDPNTVPKPSKAKKKNKPMPEYQQPPKPAEYHEPSPEKKKDKNVEVTMIDL